MIITTDRWTCPRCGVTVVLARPRHSRNTERAWQAVTRDTHRCKAAR